MEHQNQTVERGARALFTFSRSRRRKPKSPIRPNSPSQPNLSVSSRSTRVSVAGEAKPRVRRRLERVVRRHSLSPLLIRATLNGVVIGNQAPVSLLLYPYPGKSRITGNRFAFVFSFHC